MCGFPGVLDNILCGYQLDVLIKQKYLLKLRRKSLFVWKNNNGRFSVKDFFGQKVLILHNCTGLQAFLDEFIFLCIYIFGISFY